MYRTDKILANRTSWPHSQGWWREQAKFSKWHFRNFILTRFWRFNHPWYMPCVVNFKHFLCFYFLEFFYSVLQQFILVISVLLFKNGGKKEGRELQNTSPFTSQNGFSFELEKLTEEFTPFSQLQKLLTDKNWNVLQRESFANITSHGNKTW